MVKRYDAINPKFPHILHGADYNPEQWVKTPGVIDEDFRLMKLAHVNVVSLGIFAWSDIEPYEGEYDFSCLDNIMDRLAENGMYAVLATPSGARPAWLAQKYPQVLRMDENRQRHLFGGRQNHCLTSPVYREKVKQINTLLAQRYKNHPALLAWHVSNEYSGECHCPLCQEAFRNFLKEKYGTLDELNNAWWSSFWSHRINDWSQIESPAQIGEYQLHGLKLDWKCFTTHQTVDFFKNEIEPLKRITPDAPVTTNFMELCDEFDQWDLAQVEDVVAIDSYPKWHSDVKEDWRIAAETAFSDDLTRSLKGGRPYMLMENAPGAANWMNVNKIKRPGVIALQAFQAIAHGSDTVQYFQWRKSRGSFEKFHGAVVDHEGTEKTRVFREVSQLGAELEKLDEIVGSTVRSQTAVVFDYHNKWAIEDAMFSNNEHRDYVKTCIDHYVPFWKQGVPVDVISEKAQLDGYKLIVAPMAYMLRGDFAQRVEKFVKDGGTFVTTYLSGIVNDSDLCFLGGFPGPLRKAAGIWDEEQDALYPNDENALVMTGKNELGIEGAFKAHEICDVIHAETARVLAGYESDFYAGTPALTVNDYGKGHVYFIAARTGLDFLESFYGSLIKRLAIDRTINSELPVSISAQYRTNGDSDFVFIMNFSKKAESVNLDGEFRNMLSGTTESGVAEIPAYGVKILKRPHRKS